MTSPARELGAVGTRPAAFSATGDTPRASAA